MEKVDEINIIILGKINNNLAETESNVGDILFLKSKNSYYEEEELINKLKTNLKTNLDEMNSNLVNLDYSIILLDEEINNKYKQTLVLKEHIKTILKTKPDTSGSENKSNKAVYFIENILNKELIAVSENIDNSIEKIDVLIEQLNTINKSIKKLDNIEPKIMEKKKLKESIKKLKNIQKNIQKNIKINNSLITLMNKQKIKKSTTLKKNGEGKKKLKLQQTRKNKL